MNWTRLLLVGSVAWSVSAQADNNFPTISDFGGAGLLQTPTARMFDAGEVALSIHSITPYRHSNLTLQPMDWLEVNVRYTDVSNREYGPAISTQSYKDKGIDFKLALIDESYYLPAISAGFHDIGGTGLFSSEYFVASKRLADVDISFGLAWGYMGARGDIDNPFSLLVGDEYDNRQRRDNNQPAGNLNAKNLFRGSPSFFGGIQYRTPWQPLVLKLEYEGNNYQHEPQKNNQKQDSPFNIGAVFHVNDNVSIQTGIERGNEAMLGIVLHTNLAKTKPLPKLSDPKPEPLQATASDMTKTDWNDVSQRLRKNAGYNVNKISLRQNEIVLHGEQTRFFTNATGTGRAARILNNSTDNTIEWLTVIDEEKGMAIKETSVSRDMLQQLVRHDADTADLHRTLSESPVSEQEETVIYKNTVNPFRYGGGIGYKQSLGGPDEFILYQFTADGNADYYFRPDLWWTGSLSIGLLDNYDQFKYDGPSQLPRVRTDIRQYLTTSDVTIPNFQFSYTTTLGDDFYAMAYGGILETMYGGVGGEILYRPFDEELAFGIDLNWVKQRAYEQDFNFRDYDTVTGHITAYWDTGFEGILVTGSIGRYLAKDVGLTLDISRSFKNGVRMGGYFTRTDVSSAEFGEGSFDKGIYISIPFDLLLTKSTLNQATLRWTPLTRDGGARLARKYSLYRLTEDRNLGRYHNGLPQLGD